MQHRCANSCTNVLRIIWPFGKILQLLVAACTVVSKLKTERKTLHISWCIIRTRGTCVARAGKYTLSALRAKRAQPRSQDFFQSPGNEVEAS